MNDFESMFKDLDGNPIDFKTLPKSEQIKLLLIWHKMDEDEFGPPDEDEWNGWFDNEKEEYGD